MANWARELTIKINGKPCDVTGANSYSKIKRSGYLQSVLIDARKALGGKCRRQDVLVSLEITPKADPMADVTCKLKDDKSCAPSGVWDDYAPLLCTDPNESNGQCKPRPGGRGKRSDIRTYISQVISF